MASSKNNASGIAREKMFNIILGIYINGRIVRSGGKPNDATAPTTKRESSFTCYHWFLMEVKPTNATAQFGSDGSVRDEHPHRKPPL